MAELLLHGRPVPTVFDLLGRSENDMTFALAWGMAQSEGFLSDVVAAVTGGPIASADAVINLQRHDELGGFTDVELSVPGELHLIFGPSADGTCRAMRSCGFTPSAWINRRPKTAAWSCSHSGERRTSSRRASASGSSPILG